MLHYTDPLVKKATAKAIWSVLRNQAHTSTVFVSPNFTVRATRTLRKGQIPPPKDTEVTIQVGRPNYHARSFIKLAKKAGETFPIRRPQLTYTRGK